MLVGIPKEIKNREHRVSITPEGARQLIVNGHTVRVQAGAGADSGFSDAAYLDSGAVIVKTAAEAWQAELVVKVKEPLPGEYPFLRPQMILFTYLHLAAAPELAEELIRQRVCAIGYETVQLDDGGLPLLAPMSQVAGRVAVQLGARFLQKENATPFPGMGRLPGGIAHVQPCTVLILGGGNVGQHAAMTASGLGARVVILEADRKRSERLTKAMPEIEVEVYSHELLLSLLPECDLLIGATLIPGVHAPRLLARTEIALMKAQSVFVDVAIDQGGISETSRPSSYLEPVYIEERVLHCCLPNLPAAVPATSTQALTSATLQYVLELADLGLDKAFDFSPALARGVNIRDGIVVHKGLAASLQVS